MTDYFSYDHLSGLINKDLDRISEFNNIPDDLISLKPDSSRWSAQETLQHITKFNQLYLKEMDDAANSGEGLQAQSEQFKPRFIFRQLIRFLEPPYKIKIKTFAPMYPNHSDTENPKQPIETLTAVNRDLLSRIEHYRKNRLDLDRIKGKNPILRWLPMSLSEFILILEAHQRRHFWQIEQTLFQLSGKEY